MDWLISSGAAALGIVVGGIAWHFVTRMERVDMKTLSALISVIAGAGVLTIFHSVAGQDNKLPRELYWYPIGLLVGVGIVALLNYGEKDAWEEIDRLGIPTELEGEDRSSKEKVQSLVAPSVTGLHQSRAVDQAWIQAYVRL